AAGPTRPSTSRPTPGSPTATSSTPWIGSGEPASSGSAWSRRPSPYEDDNRHGDHRPRGSPGAPHRGDGARDPPLRERDPPRGGRPSRDVRRGGGHGHRVAPRAVPGLHRDPVAGGR